MTPPMHVGISSAPVDRGAGEAGVIWGILVVWLYAASYRNPQTFFVERQLSGGEIADTRLVS